MKSLERARLRGNVGAPRGHWDTHSLRVKTDRHKGKLVTVYEQTFIRVRGPGKGRRITLQWLVDKRGRLAHGPHYK